MIKIGYINFWDGSEAFIKNILIQPLQEAEYNISDKLYNPIEEECDIVFHSSFGMNRTIKRCKGNPIFIYYSGEHYCFGMIDSNEYSLTFNEDSETNLYFPIWQFDDVAIQKCREKAISKKDKFCMFVISNEKATWRNTVFDKLSEYRKVDSCGTKLNNMEDGYILSRDFKTSYNFTKDYKFNLCFENTKKNNYITEKIVNAYAYGTVPIYWGSDNVERWFNKDSFINCNNKTIEEIIDIVKYYDNNNSEYYKMLQQNPFNEPIDWKWHRETRYLEFMDKIIKEID